MTFNGYFTEHDDVLTNKLGITDPNELKALETEVVPIRMAELMENPPKGKFDYAYLSKVHRKLFSDVYQMAGKTRTVDIAKGNSVFCYAKFIEDEQKRIFKGVEKDFQRRKIGQEELATLLARLATELNALHPFREGNGRAIRVFLMLIAMRYGYHLDYTRVDTEHLMQADICAFQGDSKPLETLYREIVTID